MVYNTKLDYDTLWNRKKYVAFNPMVMLYGKLNMTNGCKMAEPTLG